MRQDQLNPRITIAEFFALIAKKLSEQLFVIRLGFVVTVHNLNRAFNTLLNELDSKLARMAEPEHFLARREQMKLRPYPASLIHCV